jgi:hypothetical protein
LGWNFSEFKSHQQTCEEKTMKTFGRNDIAGAAIMIGVIFLLCAWWEALYTADADGALGGTCNGTRVSGWSNGGYTSLCIENTQQH